MVKNRSEDGGVGFGGFRLGCISPRAPDLRRRRATLVILGQPALLGFAHGRFVAEPFVAAQQGRPATGNMTTNCVSTRNFGLLTLCVHWRGGVATLDR